MSMVLAGAPAPSYAIAVDARRDSFRLIRRSMLIASGLCLLKALTGLATGSLGVLASALDSCMDLCSSAVNFVSLKIALAPADAEHPYGHGKAEPLAGLFQGAFIAIGGLGLLAEALRRFFSGASLEHGAWGAAVMLVSTLLSAFHGARLRRAARESGSTVMAAEGAHYAVDVASNLGVAAALLLSQYGGGPLWDLAVTVLVAGYVLKASIPILLSSVSELMDEGLAQPVRLEIERLIQSHHPAVVGFHQFRARRAGSRRYIELHVEIAGVTDFRQAHDIAESLTLRIQESVPDSEVLIHYDPEGAD